MTLSKAKTLSVFFKKESNSTKKKRLDSILVDCLRGKVKAVKIREAGLFLWDDLIFQDEKLIILNTELAKEGLKDENLADILGFKIVTLNDQELGSLEDYEFDELNGKIFKYFVRSNLFKKIMGATAVLCDKDIVRIKAEKKEIIVRDLIKTKRIKAFQTTQQTETAGAL